MSVTVEQVRQSLAKIVQGKEGFVYTPVEVYDEDGEFYSHECRYLDNEGAPSCLVGHVLVDLGVTTEEIKQMEGQAADNAVPFALPGVDQAIVGGLYAAQRLQDDGKPWGEALAAFNTELESYGV